MSKGNINYKYLRGRKSWFRRNIPLVIMWAVIAVVVIVLGIIGSMKLFGYGIFKNKNNDDKKVQTVPKRRRQRRQERWYGLMIKSLLQKL